MSILLFISQTQSNFNFVIVAGCLIIESLATKNELKAVDYGWVLHTYKSIGLPDPKFCFTDACNGLKAAVKYFWPLSKTFYSCIGLIKKAEKIIESINGHGVLSSIREKI